MKMRILSSLLASAAVLASAHLGPFDTPEAGASYKAGTVMKVSWSMLVEHNTQDLAYSTDGKTWIKIVDGLNPAGSAYNWTVPNVASAKVRLRVCQRDGLKVTGCTDAHNSTSETTFPVPGGDVYTMVSGNFTIQASPTGLPAREPSQAGERKEGKAGRSARILFAGGKNGSWAFDARGRLSPASAASAGRDR